MRRLHLVKALAALAVAIALATGSAAQVSPAEAHVLLLQVVDGDGEALEGAHVVLPDGRVLTTGADGKVYGVALPSAGGSDTLQVMLLGYETRRLAAQSLKSERRLTLSETAYALPTATVSQRATTLTGHARLSDVEGVAIYAGRKSDLILPERLQANLASNNARELYKSVAGLSVWESDGAGLQLSIGARGLNPNRSANFNTRQNGFDISADALGYPESYYTPPAQALQRIELVRGAASLQYGTQFGGLLNFKLKEGDPDRKAALTTEQTVGSFGQLTHFTSVGGTVGKVSYYGFGQLRRGDGWRANAGFEQATGYLDVHYQASEKLRVGLELTRMGYRAQQAGGLLDFEFERDARQSKRARNWFDVDWGLAALHVDYALSDAAKLNVRTFVLDAQRAAVGELGPINRPDPLRERDLLIGEYRNFGQEWRLLHRFSLRGRPAPGVLGVRVYSGLTRNRQGTGTAGAAPDFTFAADSLGEASAPDGSDYRFPSRNVAVFGEQILRLTDAWSITPGVRFEYIRTASEGYYRQRVVAGNQVLLDRRVADAARNERSLVIAGLGTSYRFAKAGVEAYGNASQNYRAINFSDLVVRNPNLLIDSTLSDERGYNLELGLRGAAPSGAWRFDVSLFRLHYANRIGITERLVPDPVLVEREVSVRTNIGAAVLQGVEFYAETDLLKLLGREASKWSLAPFLNASLIDGRYTSGASSVRGRRVEYVPRTSVKTGVACARGPWRAQLLYTHVGEQYSDATNAVRVADATRGRIPAYRVWDFTSSYTLGRWRLQVGCNNALDARYFTRRATGYPGPGIIPAQARSVYAGLRLSL